MKLIRKIIGITLLLFSALFAVGLLEATNLIMGGSALIGVIQLVTSAMLTFGFYSFAKKVYPSSLRIF